jgi:hypothetical protein
MGGNESNASSDQDSVHEKPTLDKKTLIMKLNVNNDMCHLPIENVMKINVNNDMCHLPISNVMKINVNNDICYLPRDEKDIPLPKPKFDDTVYMKHYSELEDKCPPLSKWVEGLCKIFPNHESEMQSCIEASKDDDEAAVKIWTWSTDIPQAINFALMIDAYYTFDLKEIDITYAESKLKRWKLDYKEVIENSIKFIKRVNTVIAEVSTDANTEDRVVYRWVPAKLFPNVKVGDKFRIANYLVTTDNKFIVEQFSRSTGSDQQITSLTIEIPKHCCNAGKIACYSMFPYEEETLIPPYTSFKLVSRDGNNMHLVVAQDNSEAPFEKYSF